MKKRPQKKKSNRPPLSKISYIFIFTLFIVVMGLIFTFFNSRSQNYCANSISCIKDISGKYDLKAKDAFFMGKNISVPSEIARNIVEKPVLGETTPSNKHIYVDLTNQRLYAYEGNKLIYNFLVSTGKWGRTPTGDFKIWVKLRYTRMSGGNQALGTYYNLPNVPYVMFYYNNEVPKGQGFSIHGAYWHNNFGHPMSHGCVNMKIEEVEKLYYWADPETNGNTTYPTDENPSTPITVYGEAPNE